MATIKGTNSGETKTGTTAADYIYGYGGNDSLYGRAGNDQIWGGDGADSIWGEGNNDILRGEIGNDSIYAGDGNDVVYGGSGDDRLYGDAGTDTVKGAAGNDVIKGGSGISYLLGGNGNDSLYYSPSTTNMSALGDYLSGSQMNGDAGTDTLYIDNKTVYTSGTAIKASQTSIFIDQDGQGRISFTKSDGTWNERESMAGTFKNMEKVVLSGSGGLPSPPTIMALALVLMLPGQLLTTLFGAERLQTRSGAAARFSDFWCGFDFRRCLVIRRPSVLG